jgi:Ca2+-binding RTX toxin-like protein
MLVPNFGDNTAFTLGGATLKTNAALDFETKTSYLVGVRSTDAGGLGFEKVFTINVTDVAENANTPPTIAVARGGSINGTASGTMNLAVADANGDALSLSASSSNTSLVPGGNITFGGSGASRTVRITALPKNTATSATVTITVSDGKGGTATTTIGVLVGSDKKETLTGTSGADLIFGMAGDDTINASGGHDLISGDKGNDTLSGGDGDDTLFGGDGNDKLTGGNGADAFSGGAGKDTSADFNPAQGDTRDNTFP